MDPSLIFFALFFVAGSAVTKAGGDKACDTSQETLMKYGWECLADHPDLMVEIINHMKQPDTMANLEFVCSNQAAVVDVTVCMEKKMAVCIPEEYRGLVLKYLDHNKLSEVLSFVCAHKGELNDQCMDDSANQEFAQCMQERGQDLAGMLAVAQLTSNDLMPLLCRFDKAFEGCLAAHHGKCSSTFVSLMDQMMAKLLPPHVCDGVNLSRDLPANKLLGSLLGGDAMKFIPEGQKKRLSGYNLA